jgi:hypothetical protein
MINTIFFFMSLFTVKTIILEYFFNNYLLYLYHPFELAILSLQSVNNYSNKTYEQSYLRWTFIGWIDYNYESNVINNIDNKFISSIDDNSYSIIISWFGSFILYQFYYILKEKIQKKKLNKWSLINYNIKYFLINYTFLYLWNLNTLLELNDISFITIFFNFLIFNLTAFWLPGIIFNYIYGEKLYLFRVKFNFLIEYINPKYKYFIIILFFLKALNGIYIILVKYENVYSKYILLINLVIFSILLNFINIFIKLQVKRLFLIQNLLSLIIIILSILEIYYFDNIILFILQMSFIFLNLCYIAFSYKKAKQLNIQYIEDAYELDNL